ncbi:MAG: glycogen debranching enzyme N-terminal domain-containing protein, partial [Gemmatimonadetes bacterium]|nr:glycogen debranching enzyme N-terminal domain-containing protein [Gemmatimonadota bacterium]
MTADDLVREDNFSREWLETNGLGGWASSTVSGAHTRRYHGLLVVATCPPVGRVVLLSRLDETLVLPTRRVELSCSIFPGVIHPRGDQWLKDFAPEPVPTWTYAGDGWVLRKRLALLAGEHALVVAYELVKASEPLCLELRPFFAGRDYHHLMQANDQVAPTADWTEDALVYQPYRD